MTMWPTVAGAAAGMVVMAALRSVVAPPVASRPATQVDVSGRPNTIGSAATSSTDRPRTAPGAEVGRELAEARDRLSRAEARLRSSSEEHDVANDVRATAEAKTRRAMDGLAALAPITLTREPRGMVITIPARGLFVFDEPRLSDRAEGRLGPVAEALSQQRDHRILVEDHSAVLGTSRPELSQARAEAVRHFFVSRGVPSDRLEAIGDERPPPTAGPPVHDPRVEIVVESVGPR